MGKRGAIKTTRSEVFDYWRDKAIMPGGEVVPARDMPEGAVPVVEDWGEPCCWGCGRGFQKLYRMRKYGRLIGSDDIDDIAAIWDLPPVELERCHVLADAAGGEDKPENLFLLCRRCHAESPDTTEPLYFFRWIHRQRGRGDELRRLLLQGTARCVPGRVPGRCGFCGIGESGSPSPPWSRAWPTRAGICRQERTSTSSCVGMEDSRIFERGGRAAAAGGIITGTEGNRRHVCFLSIPVMILAKACVGQELEENVAAFHAIRRNSTFYPWISVCSSACLWRIIIIEEAGTRRRLLL